MYFCVITVEVWVPSSYYVLLAAAPVVLGIEWYCGSVFRNLYVLSYQKVFHFTAKAIRFSFKQYRKHTLKFMLVVNSLHKLGIFCNTLTVSYFEWWTHRGGHEEFCADVDSSSSLPIGIGCWQSHKPSHKTSNHKTC